MDEPRISASLGRGNERSKAARSVPEREPFAARAASRNDDEQSAKRTEIVWFVVRQRFTRRSLSSA